MVDDATRFMFVALLATKDEAAQAVKKIMAWAEETDRELKEEAGYGARRLDVVRLLSLAPVYMSHETTVVLARDLYPERLPGDEPEELEVVPWPLADIGELALREDFSEGRSIAALFAARQYLERERA